MRQVTGQTTGLSSQAGARTHLGVKNRKLGEHAHVRALESETSLEKRDELVGVALMLVQTNKSL